LAQSQPGSMSYSWKIPRQIKTDQVDHLSNPIKTMEEAIISQARILVQRLERLSADSVWAHRASGLRASLDKFLAKNSDDPDTDKMDSLIQEGFHILEEAAKEIRSVDDS